MALPVFIGNHTLFPLTAQQNSKYTQYSIGELKIDYEAGNGMLVDGMIGACFVQPQ